MNRLLCVLPFVFLSWIRSTDAGCWQRRLCCHGRNTSCKANDDGVAHLPMHGAAAERHNHFQKIRERYGFSVGTSTTVESWPVPHYEGSGDDVRLVYPDVYDTMHNEKIGHLIMPDIVELEGSGRNLLYEKYEGSGSRSERGILDEAALLSEPSTTIGPSKIQMFKHLIFGEQVDQDEPPVDQLHFQEKPRHLLVRGENSQEGYSLLQRHVPVTVSSTFYSDEDAPKLMFLEAPEVECYCDEECIKLGDCCSDYTYVCPPQDCMVDHWSTWDPCMPDKGVCGIGMQKRDRRVRWQPARGGAECPPLLEMRTCWKECSEKSIDDITTVALLLDYSFNGTRSKVSRNTVYWDLPDVKTKLNKATYYCVEYELGWVNKNCVDKEITKRLHRGNRICAECQPEAQIHRATGRCASDLDDGESGFWKLIGPKSCNGIWTRIRRTEDCRCSKNDPKLDPFLLV